MSWTQPECEKCWINENAIWEPIEGVGEVLRGVRQPSRISEAPIEKCCMCGDITISGIYVRRDPEIVPYPRLEDEHV